MTDGTTYMLQPFTRIHLDRDVDRMNLVNGSDPIYSYILSGIALFILLIASINFVNLTVARSLKRAKEIGIRKVIGSTRRQLMAQFLGEAYLLSFVSWVLGMVLVRAALPVFNGLANKSLSLSYLIDARLMAAYAALFVLTGLLAGFYPALVLSGYDPVRTLYNRFTLGGKNYGQKSLVVIQFALASFLIIATATLYAQFNFLTNERLGYDDSNLVVTYKDDLSRKEVDLLRQELSKNPDILGAAPKDNGFSFNGGKINGDSAISFVNTTIDEGYLPLLKIPIVKGRNFSPAFPADSSGSVLVNEAFVKQAGWSEPLGQAVVLWGRTAHVVGVVKDYHVEALNTEIKPQLFSIGLGTGFGDIYIRIRPKTETGSLQYIAQTFRKLFPLSPWTYSFQNETNQKNYESEARWKQILLLGAVITILISCVGLFGLSVLAAERRTKEIGVRKVLGASIGNVVSILSKDFLKLVFVSLLIAIPLSWIAASKWLEHYPYRIQLGWEMFAGAAIVVAGIALVTVSFQAVKAAMSNPAKSLRTE
jgi:putative ABC transport system permease protein